MFNCANLYVDVRTYAAGHRHHDHRSDRRQREFRQQDSVYQPPANGSDATVVVRAFYQWPLFVTGLGYNIANIGRGTSNSYRLLAATAAFRPQ